MQVKDQVSASKFRNTAPPGAQPHNSPEPKKDVKDAVELRFSEKGPDSAGLSGWQKVVAGTMAGVAGLAAFAPKANAAPIDALVTQSISQSDGLEVTVLPQGTARVDVLRRVTGYQSRTAGSHGTREVHADYSDVGVHLGRGLFHDGNGNLVLVPSLAAGWEDGISDFKRVEIDSPGYDDTVTRWGNTVHHKESSYSRNVYVEQGDTMQIHHRGESTQYEVLSNGVQYRGEEGLEWRVTQNGNSLEVDGPGENDVRLIYAANGIDILGTNGNNSVTHSPTEIRVRGAGTDYEVTRSGAGVITNVEASGPFNDYTIIRDGNNIRVEGPFNTRGLVVNPAEFMQRQEINFGELSRMIEEAEPGYAEKHPLVMGLLEYATANPGLVGEDDNETGFLQAGTGIATGGGALASGQALMTGAQALSLAENARALGAAALRAQAAAQAAAQAGNLTQAAAMGAEASNLAGQARALGGEAMRIGEAAQNTAQVAQIMTGVAGALEIIDGGMDLHRGASNRSIVEGAIVITESLRERLSAEQTGAELEQTMEDYSKVMEILQGLKKNADKQIRVGGLKIGCGGLMLISALAGGAIIPPIIGVVGMACTAGTAVYEHWDEMKAFFTGDQVEPDPTLREMLPDQLHDEILFKLD